MATPHNDGSLKAACTEIMCVFSAMKRSGIMNKIFDKRIYFIFLTAITVSGFLIICTLGQTVRHERIESKLEVAAQDEPKPLYVIREHNGKIAVFCWGSSRPFRYLDFNISLLPDFDREQLREGIELYNEEELETYIQDVEG